MSTLTAKTKTLILERLQSGADAGALATEYNVPATTIHSCYGLLGAAAGVQARGIKKRQRFTRKFLSHVALTDDDKKIIAYVAAHRFRRSTDIARHLDRSLKKVVERLTELFNAGYLDRPPAQLEMHTALAQGPMVYALGNKGAEHLAEALADTTTTINWTDKNRSVGRPFIKHALLIGDVIDATTRIPQRNPNIQPITRDQLLATAPTKTQRSRDPWKLTASIVTDGLTQPAISIIPDQAFGLDFTAARKRSYFFVEADNATMPVWRSDLLRQSSMRKKFLVYLAFHAARLHTEHYGIGNFRVLVVSTSDERLANMIDALTKLTNGIGSNLFLFATAKAITQCTDLAAVAWISGKGETIHLSD